VTALASGALLLLQATTLQQAGGGVSWHVAEELPASPPPATSLCGLDPLLRGPTHCFAAASHARLQVWSAEPLPAEGGLQLLTAELATCLEVRVRVRVIVRTRARVSLTLTSTLP
jgi:hypothetical protein